MGSTPRKLRHPTAPLSTYSLSFSPPHPTHLTSRRAPQGTSTFDRSTKLRKAGATGCYAANMAPTEYAKRCRKGAGKGSALDQYAFGRLHCSGEEGVRRNLTTAAEWIQKAATQGLPQAQAVLGDMYMGGEGVERDMERAVVWWRKAASQDPDIEEKGQRESILSARSDLATLTTLAGKGLIQVLFSVHLCAAGFNLLDTSCHHAFNSSNALSSSHSGCSKGPRKR
jgi:hypothetical protein